MYVDEIKESQKQIFQNNGENKRIRKQLGKHFMTLYTYMYVNVYGL